MVPTGASRTMHDTMFCKILFMEFHGEVLAYVANKKALSEIYFSVSRYVIV
jgi:hypothetical protein